MPHCILEHSTNVLDAPDLRALLLDLHAMLVASGEFRLEDIKSRAVAHELFAVGDGAPDRAFVSLDIQVLDGRSDETKARLAEAALALLARAFPRTAATGRSSLTVQISDMHRASYRRIAATA